MVDAETGGGHDRFAVVDIFNGLYSGQTSAHVGWCVRLDGRVDSQRATKAKEVHSTLRSTRVVILVMISHSVRV